MSRTFDQLGVDFVVKAISHVQKIFIGSVVLFKDHEEWRNSKGGYFGLYYATPHCSTIPIVITPIQSPYGEMTCDTAEIDLGYCEANAKSLANDATKSSSWETCATRGAIRVGNLILSFAGISPTGNEALMVAVCTALFKNDDRSKAAQTIPRLEENPYWITLRDNLDRIISA